jgi:hypothetical protein
VSPEIESWLDRAAGDAPAVDLVDGRKDLLCEVSCPLPGFLAVHLANLSSDPLYAVQVSVFTPGGPAEFLAPRPLVDLVPGATFSWICPYLAKEDVSCLVVCLADGSCGAEGNSAEVLLCSERVWLAAASAGVHSKLASWVNFAKEFSAEDVQLPPGLDVPSIAAILRDCAGDSVTPFRGEDGESLLPAWSGPRLGVFAYLPSPSLLRLVAPPHLVEKIRDALSRVTPRAGSPLATAFLLGREVGILFDYLSIDWYVPDARPHIRAIAAACDRLGIPNPLAAREYLLAGISRFSDMPLVGRRQFEEALEQLNAALSGG